MKFLKISLDVKDGGFCRNIRGSGSGKSNVYERFVDLSDLTRKSRLRQRKEITVL